MPNKESGMQPQTWHHEGGKRIKTDSGQEAFTVSYSVTYKGKAANLLLNYTLQPDPQDPNKGKIIKTDAFITEGEIRTAVQYDSPGECTYLLREVPAKESSQESTFNLELIAQQ